MQLNWRPPRTGRPASQSPGKWVTVRKVVQYLLLAFFIVLFIWAGRPTAPKSLINLPMLLDPLLQIPYLLASRNFQLASSLALIVLILSIVFGRVWCGWICPLGTTLDIFSPSRLRRRDSSNQTPAESWRVVKYSLLIAILTAALFGNLTLLILDPLTILFRTLTLSIWPALNSIVSRIELLLYSVPFLSDPIVAFDARLRPGIFPVEPVSYRNTLLYGGVFFGIILLNFLAPRFWCRYICPLGGMLGLLSKLALFRRRVAPDCKGCTLCTQACPTGTIDPGRDYASDPSECTMCLDCLESCPRDWISFSPRFSVAEWREYDPGRRQFLTTAGLTIASLAMLQVDASKKSPHPFLLRPPGSTEDDLLTKCVRCAECMRLCPTGALQSLIAGASIESLWTPVVVPRLGYCDYSCNACGQICPAGVIPAFSLEEKRQQVIGKATIDKDRCLPWSEDTACIVCEEMCPIPEKAIKLEPTQKIDANGEPVEIKLPHVDHKLCIGCGICEYKCPVSGHAAIRVFVPNLEQPV